MLQAARVAFAVTMFLCGLLLAAMGDDIIGRSHRSPMSGRSAAYDDPVLQELRELEIRFWFGAICYY